MGCGCDRSELRCRASDHSHGAREDARGDKEEAVGAAQRGTAARRARTTVLNVLARVHVENCETLHSIGREVYRRLLWYDSDAYQADFGFGTRRIATNTAHSI